MVDDRAQDLLSIDRAVGRGWASLSRWRASLEAEPDAFDDSPLEAERRVAGQSMAEALAALSPSKADVALRDALRRWVLVLTQARIAAPDEASSARLALEPLGRYTGERSGPREVSWREGWRGVVAAPTAAGAALWLEAVTRIGPVLAAAARRRAERRAEVARRFGLAHPWAFFVAVPRDTLRAAASHLLDATEDLSRAVWKEAVGSNLTAARVLHAAVGREAGEGWPARLHPRWLEDAFGGALRGARVDLAPLPGAFGAASFARALASFGYALGLAAAPKSMPFALAHDPAFFSPHRLGLTLASLPSSASWQSRVLGVGARGAVAQARVLARSALLDARLQAARVLLGDDAAWAPLERFEELAVRLFGEAPSAELAGAWPRVRDDDPARFLALLEVPAFRDHLRDRFDDDWYRNPRAWAELRAPGPAAVPPSPEAAALSTQVDGVAKAFAEALA